MKYLNNTDVIKLFDPSTPANEYALSGLPNLRAFYSIRTGISHFI